MVDNTEMEQTALEVAQPVENKLYKRAAKSYPEISAQQRQEQIAKAVRQQRENLARNVGRRVNLRDPVEMQAEIDDYLQSCEKHGQVPTMLGFAAHCGYTRLNLYAFLRNHPEDESAKLLDNFRSGSAAILAAASMNRSTDNATSIFLLKNSNLGLSDRQEVELTRGIDPTPRQTAEDIMHKYEGIGGLPDC